MLKYFVIFLSPFLSIYYFIYFYYDDAMILFNYLCFE